MTAVRDSYLSCAETAKLVRKHLKADFPGVTFRVRSSNYAGGASIHVDWLDGPTSYQVDAVLSLYAGASFDGMIDLKSYHDSILVDENGEAKVVHFGADHVMGQRGFTAETIAKVRAQVEKCAGDEPGSYDPNKRYALAAMRATDGDNFYDEAGRKVVAEAFAEEFCFAINSHGGEYGSTLIYQYLQDKVLPIAPKGAQRCY